MAFQVLMHSHRREPAEALDSAERLITVALEEHQMYWLQAAVIVRGWATACMGDVEQGIAGMREGIAAYSSTGAGVSLPHFHGLLTEVLITQNRLDEAQTELSKAFSIAEANQELLAEIGLWRLHGELAEANGDRDGALESCFRAVKLAEEIAAFGPGLHGDY
jgi:predicted ATPase